MLKTFNFVPLLSILKSFVLWRYYHWLIGNIIRGKKAMHFLSHRNHARSHSSFFQSIMDIKFSFCLPMEKKKSSLPRQCWSTRARCPVSLSKNCRLVKIVSGSLDFSLASSEENVCVQIKCFLIIVSFSYQHDIFKFVGTSN